jgi:hypothetical protein
MIENILLASILNDREYLTTNLNYKNKILKNIPQFIKIRNYPQEWNIIPSIKLALKHERTRNAGGWKREDYLNTTPLFNDNPITEMAILCWNLLELSYGNKNNRFKKALILFNDIAKSQVNGDKGMLPIDKVSPYDALNTASICHIQK